MVGQPEVEIFRPYNLNRLTFSPLYKSTADSVLPPQVALAQDNVFDGNPQHFTLPQNDHSLFFISLLDHRNSAPQQCHTVAFFESSVLLLTQIVLLNQVNDVIQTICVIPSRVPPQANAFAVEKHEDVGTERAH